MRRRQWMKLNDWSVSRGRCHVTVSRLTGWWYRWSHVIELSVEVIKVTATDVCWRRRCPWPDMTSVTSVKAGVASLTADHPPCRRLLSPVSVSTRSSTPLRLARRAAEPWHNVGTRCDAGIVTEWWPASGRMALVTRRWQKEGVLDCWCKTLGAQRTAWPGS